MSYEPRTGVGEAVGTGLQAACDGMPVELAQAGAMRIQECLVILAAATGGAGGVPLDGVQSCLALASQRLETAGEVLQTAREGLSAYAGSIGLSDFRACQADGEMTGGPALQGEKHDLSLPPDFRLPEPRQWDASKLRQRGALELLPNIDRPTVVRKWSLPNDAHRAILEALTNESHPHLLGPLAFTVLPDGALVEDYPVVKEPDLGQALPVLKDALRQGKININHIVDLGLQLADALSYLHRRDIIHRDLTIRKNRSNAFVGIRHGKLHVTVFDYNLADRATRFLDGQFDVFKAGEILRLLTHDYDSPSQSYAPYIDPSHPLVGIIDTALAPSNARHHGRPCYKNAMELHSALSSIRRA